MAGVPWQPDLADVFEADLATADNLTDPVDTTPEERTVDTVQAILMGGDLLNEPESERVLSVKQQTNENMEQESSEPISNISVQEIQFSNDLLAETSDISGQLGDNTSEITGDAVGVGDSHQALETYTLSVAAASSPPCTEITTETITVLHSTLGMEEGREEGVVPVMSEKERADILTRSETSFLETCFNQPEPPLLVEYEQFSTEVSPLSNSLLKGDPASTNSDNLGTESDGVNDTIDTVGDKFTDSLPSSSVSTGKTVVTREEVHSVTPVQVPTVETLTSVNCTVGEAFLHLGSADPDDAEVAALTGACPSGQYVVYGGDGSQYIISESPINQCVVTESLSLEDQMRALHGPSPEPCLVPTFQQTAVPDLLSLVVQETIPLRLNMSTGEMEPDVEAGKGLVPTQSGAWVTPRQEEVFNIISESLEVFPQDDLKLSKKSPIKKSVSESMVKKGSNVATVKPFNSLNSHKSSKLAKPPKISTSPIKLKAVMSSSPTHSSAGRPPSSVKCQCARHMVIGYPPAKVYYWTVGTTPGINSTYMDFDNEGVKFLYDQGDLKSFQSVLSSFKPEFLSTEKSLEVSLCLSCVRWAEKEFKTMKQKRKDELEKARKEKVKKVEKSRKEKATVMLAEEDNSFKGKFKCIVCKKLVSSPLEFKNHVKEVHQTGAPSNLESKRSSTSSKCKCLSHMDIFHGYSFMREPPVTYRMNFSKTEENTLALRFYKQNSMLADSEPSLLCSFCVHFANQQVDKTRPRSPTKRVALVRKRSLSPALKKVKRKRNSSSSSDSSSSSGSSSSEDSDSDPDDGACEVPGCKAVLNRPSALANHMKTKHPEYLKKKNSSKKYKSGVIKPVRVDLEKLSKAKIERMTKPRLPVGSEGSEVVSDPTENLNSSVPDIEVVDHSNIATRHVQEILKEVCEELNSRTDSPTSDNAILDKTLDSVDIDEAIDTKKSMDQVSTDLDTSMEEMASSVSIKNPVDKIVDTKPEEVTPVLSARKRKAINALKIDMVSDTFSPGAAGSGSRRGRSNRNEEKVEEGNAGKKEVEVKLYLPLKDKKKIVNSTNVESSKIESCVDHEKDTFEEGSKVNEIKPPNSTATAETKSKRISRRSEDSAALPNGEEDEKLKTTIKSPAESSLVRQLQMDLVGDSVTPSRFSRRKEVVEIAGKTGNKLLDQLKVDMVVDAIVPRGKRRAAENVQDQKSAKKAKVAPVDQVPVRLKTFAAKVFRRIQRGENIKSEGHQQLLGRLPGLTHMGFGKEYNKWVKENPVTENGEDEPDEENNLSKEEKEVEKVAPMIPKKMCLKLVNILATDEALVKGNEERKVEKLKSMKESLVEILSAGDLKDEEKKLLKEIKELIDI